MEQYAKLKSLVLAAEDDFSKFYEKGNKAAGTRARKAMQEVKALAQDIRKEIQDRKGED
ncbi:MAG: histone H1 [Bacteroidia bacterium]|nr:histone H1 [Bacteroidia bacterium]